MQLLLFDKFLWSTKMNNCEDLSMKSELNKNYNDNKNLPVQKLSDFSIEYILSNKIGQKCDENKMKMVQRKDEGYTNDSPQIYDWLYYTRYHPPRLPRVGTNPLKQPVKRTPGRLPRVPFTPEQLKALENAYKKSMYLSSEEANNLAKQLDLSSIRVKIWFQNRRARDRRENRSDLSQFSDRSWSDDERLSFRYQ